MRKSLYVIDCTNTRNWSNQLHMNDRKLNFWPHVNESGMPTCLIPSFTDTLT